jgi:hypothetical protein
MALKGERTVEFDECFVAKLKNAEPRAAWAGSCQFVVKKGSVGLPALTRLEGVVAGYSMQTQEATHVFRDPIEEYRDGYIVVYQPADARSPFATLTLTFTDDPVQISVAAKAMERELENWLKKYPVPVRVSGFDAQKKLIRHSPNLSECHLSGYVRLWDAAIVRRWASLSDRELPEDQSGPRYLERAYRGMPYRVREEDRECLRREKREKAVGISQALLLMLGIPLVVMAIHMGGDGVAWVVAATVFALGALKLAGHLEWRKPRRSERKQKLRQATAEHYFYHCEKNPDAFLRLKQENLDREVIEERKKDAARQMNGAAGRKVWLGRRLIVAAQAFRTAG